MCHGYRALLARASYHGWRSAEAIVDNRFCGVIRQSIPTRSAFVPLEAQEKEILESVERSEWRSAKGGKREHSRYAAYAKATFRKDRRINIRISSKDLEAIRRRALEEGLPYQTLVSSLLHKYASGRLRNS
jgi:predicted DNA binding CopG/RHH family protein